MRLYLLAMSKFIVPLFAIIVSMVAVGCSGGNEPEEKLPPAKIQPDSSKPTSTDNPGGNAPVSAQ